MSRGAAPLCPVDDGTCRRETGRPAHLPDLLGGFRKFPPWRILLLSWLTLASAAATASIQGPDRWALLGPSQGLEPHHHSSGIGAWTPWGGWSACSSSCGDGVSFRIRRCIRFPEEDPCQGNARQYRLCALDGCPGGSVPFRDLQCSLYDGKPLSGSLGGFRWVPFHGAPNLCDLNCLAEGHNFYYTFGRVLDGTPCSREPGGGLCVSGQCLQAGCDGILGSEAQADACGVCAGQNDSCALVKEVFFVGAAVPIEGFLGYRNVTRIPAGARHLQVTDHSRNYLALADVNQRYVLNGDWTIGQPGLYEAAGTRVRYLRTADGQESLEAEGPTLEDLWVTVLFQEPKAGIEYQFWLPKERFQNDAGPLQQPQARQAEGALVAMGESLPFPGATMTAPHFQSARKSHRQTPPRAPVRSGRCGKCETPRGRSQRIHHYCNSDFVFRARVLSKRRVGQETRYDLQVKQTYRNRFPLVQREYAWAPDTCDCPPLTERREYVVMAQSHVNFEHTLNRILLRPGSYVRPWSPREDLQLRDAALRCRPDVAR